MVANETKLRLGNKSFYTVRKMEIEQVRPGLTIVSVSFNFPPVRGRGRNYRVVQNRKLTSVN